MRMGLPAPLRKPTNNVGVVRNLPRVGSDNPTASDPAPVARCQTFDQHPFGDQATALNNGISFEIRFSQLLPKLRFECGPWFCVPALRLVCLFEDDDAAGPYYAEIQIALRRPGFEPD